MNALESRIPPPLLFLAVAIVMRLSARGAPPPPGSLVRWMVVGGFALAALVGPLGVFEFRRARTTIDPVHVDRASTLVTSGVFSLTRNPMYVSMVCLLSAWAAHLGTAWGWLGPLGFLLFIHRFQIVPEERAMARRFGEEYQRYRARVRRWI